MRGSRSDKALAKGIRRLSKLQNKDGSFPSMSFERDRTMRNAVERRVTFPSILILSSISRIRGAERIAKRARAFVLGQKSSTWSWNYVVRGYEAKESMRYPDDLDDTSCALASLSLARADVGGQALASFVSHLMRAEERAGGPYKTWIADNKAPWNDVDTAVNANIAYALALHGVRLEGLDTYLVRAASLSFSSLYYHRDEAVIYFLARYLSMRKDRAALGARRTLVKRIDRILKRPVDALACALCVSSLARLDEPEKAPLCLPALLSRQRQNGGWDACAFHIEEIKSGVRSYSGSESLTTAFALEAIVLCHIKDAKERQTEDDARRAQILSAIRSKFGRSFPSEMKQDALELRKRFELKGLESFVALLPYLFARGMTKPEASDVTLVRLGLANLLGWIGYTIQDDIMDEGSDARLLPLSNTCIRKAKDLLEEEAPPRGRNFIREVFDEMDSANAWEARHTRLPKAKARFSVPRYIPRENLRLLAHKSFGHALGPLILAMKSGFLPGSKGFESLRAFFEHYLVARQLNDDAHDWEEDLSEGRINPTSWEMLKKVRGSIDEKNLVKIREIFWKSEIDTVCDTIEKHVQRAREEAMRSGIIRSEYVETLLSPLLASARKALSERDKTQEFLKTYK
jgi:hypothetical protein